MSAPGEIVADIRRELAAAAYTIVSQVEAGVAATARARDGGPDALSAVDQALSAIMEACIFADLASQRLCQLEAHLRPGALSTVPDDPLLQGPEGHGRGLDQAAVDALFA